MHALRAENAALRAETAALRADAGAPTSASFRPPPDDSAVSLPHDVRTWESAGAGDALSGADLERYARHISLPAFGAAKQASLANARALIVGVGGLGSPASLYLAAAGVGRLALADADVVERSNLHRQIAHADARRGASKALSAATSIAALNPSCQLTTHTEGVTPANALALVRDADVVLDCTDNVQTRYLLSDACASAGKPLVSAAAVGTEGQLTVYVRDRATTAVRDAGAGLEPDARDARELPCYRCVFPTPPAARDRGNCARSGVLGPVPGALGTLQALEALKVLSGLGERNGGRLLMFDATADPKRAFRCVALRGRDARCVACGDGASAPGAPRGEAIASYDYDAFVGERAACETRTNPATGKGNEKEKDVDALPAALDDAAAAAARNVARHRGDGGAPWATDDGPRLVGAGADAASPRETREKTLVAATLRLLDAAAKPPLHARKEADGRVTPSSLVAARRALGDAAVIRGAELPPIAQKAQQEAQYLARCFNGHYAQFDSALIPRGAGSGSAAAAAAAASPSLPPPPDAGFEPRLIGSMASIGTTSLEGYLDMTAVGDPTPGGATYRGPTASGLLAWVSWHGAYLVMKQKSVKNRILIAVGWLKTFAFGRDISRF